jgi:hypothetical protein
MMSQTTVRISGNLDFETYTDLVSTSCPAWRFGCTDPKFQDAACGTQYCDAKLAGSGMLECSYAQYLTDSCRYRQQAHVEMS